MAKISSDPAPQTIGRHPTAAVVNYKEC